MPAESVNGNGVVPTTGEADELFVSPTNRSQSGADAHSNTGAQKTLSVNEKPRNGRPCFHGRTSTCLTHSLENMPPHMRTAHRPTRSQEDDRRRQARPHNTNDPLDVFADPRPQGSPRRRAEGRPRRNSDPSVADPDEERRRRERRHREREYRTRDSKGRPVPQSGPRPKKPNHRLDVIDKLDVTSIFGMGGERTSLPR